jgi:hypothetical protein
MMPDLWATRQIEIVRAIGMERLAAYCHVTPVEQNQNEKQKDTVSGMGATKAVIGNCTPLTHSLFGSDIPRR